MMKKIANQRERRAKMIPQYSTELFSDVFPTSDDLVNGYTSSELYNNEEQVDIKRAYALLLARYGNTPIANKSVEQFKIKLYSVLFQHLANYVEKLNMQKLVRKLTVDDFLQGSKAVYNHAFNPGDAPSTSGTEELPYINEQNATNYKRSISEAIGIKTELISENITEQFLKFFKYLFKSVVVPDVNVLYEDDCNNEI